MNNKLVIIVLVVAALSAATTKAEYTDGFYIINEDWYGHNNSTVNFFHPDDPDGYYWDYRVFKAENPGHELGATSCHGAIHNGKFYIISKQERDPGASITGGRVTVCDALTMNVECQLVDIDPQGGRADGRGFLAVSDTKGYISTSNGVFVMDLRTNKVKRRIAGTENPNGSDDLPNSNPASSLYFGQCGSMVISGKYVFIAHQQYGLLVVNKDTDKVISTISMDIIAENAGIGSVIVSKDDTIWCSIAADKDGTGETLPYLLEVNPNTLATTLHALPEGIFPPANSWYAWTPDGFCASSVRNALYWNGGNNSWFSNSMIFRYDIDTDEYEKIIDLDEQGEGWKLYGCSMRLHPRTDELYLSLFIAFGNTTYTFRRCDYMGNTIKEYPMIANYWFPSLPVFPEYKASGIDDIEVDANDAPVMYYDLYGRCLGSDESRLPSGILVRKQGNTSTKIFNR